jgi:serine/threonine protein kinase
MAATTDPMKSLGLAPKSQGLMKTPLGEFQIGKTLGEGSYGKVKLIVNVATHEKVS